MCNNTPHVSVVIPAYNQARFLTNSIQSALEQTYRDLEVIVVDDGSIDNSCDVVANFGDQVRYIRQVNRGLAGARNTGILTARGELIGLLDADDVWLPGYLESMISLVNEHSDAAVYYCYAQSMDERGDTLPQVFGRSALPSSRMYEDLLRANYLIPSTILMRKSVVMDAGLFDQSLRSCEDWDLWLRILPKHKFIGIPECLVHYRLHGKSLSTDPTEMQRATLAVIKKHFGEDDGKPQDWSWEKRRAYGGVYRYHTLTSAQRQNNWKVAGSYLRLALLADPTIRNDLDLFYDLAHGNQPVGYRDTAYQLNLEENSEHLIEMLKSIPNSLNAAEMAGVSRRALGTASYALGLIAYNMGRFKQSRRFLFNAMRYRPGLLGDMRVLATFSKSMLSQPMLGKLRNFRRPISS